MTVLLAAAPGVFTGSGVDPAQSLVVAGIATVALLTCLVRYASRRSREEATRSGQAEPLFRPRIH